MGGMKLLTSTEAAAYLGITRGALEKDRCSGFSTVGRSLGVPYLKLGTKIVRYDQADLDAWLQSRRRTP